MGRKLKLTASSLYHASHLRASSVRSCGCSFSRALSLSSARWRFTSNARSSRRCASCSTTYAIQKRDDQCPTARSSSTGAAGTRSFVRRKERCCSGKKASIDQPCVRSMVSSRRVGGGARSSAIIHWIMGNTPLGCGSSEECVTNATYPIDPIASVRY